MADSLNIASIISFKSELFVMDSVAGKFYRIQAEEVDPEKAGVIMRAVRGEMRRSVPEIPNEVIAEVMGAEREVYEKNKENTFRR
jgi:hypothetical protein